VALAAVMSSQTHRDLSAVPPDARRLDGGKQAGGRLTTAAVRASCMPGVHSAAGITPASRPHPADQGVTLQPSFRRPCT